MSLPALSELPGRIAAFVQSWGAAGSFDDLALSLFAYQYQRNLPYQRFCDYQGVDPGNAHRWQDIPAVPADAFRTQSLSCSDLPPAAVFRTSGTTRAVSDDPAQANPATAPATPGSIQDRGSHLLDAAALELYTLSLQTSFARLASRAARLPIRALLAPYSLAPESSLSFMVSSLAEAGKARESYFFWKDDRLDLTEARARLSREETPVLLFTTAFALLELIESLHTPLRLHPGSMVIETGGFKGRRRSVERDELYDLAAQGLGVPLQNIGSEYGMCEMASQFYDRHLQDNGPPPISPDAGPGPVKVGPPWVRSILIDPSTGQPSAAGETGILRHYDLCNLNSVLAIQTADLGQPGPSGEGFILHGRLQGAPARGCSLTIEEWRDGTAGDLYRGAE